MKEKAKLLWINDKQVFKSVRRKAEEQEGKDKMLEENIRLKTSGEKWTVTISNCGRIRGFLEQRNLVFSLNVCLLIWCSSLLSHLPLILNTQSQESRVKRWGCNTWDTSWANWEKICKWNWFSWNRTSETQTSVSSNHFLLLPPGKNRNLGRLFQFLLNTERDVEVRM